MKTLVVANRKGGVGKTLISTHAAWWFAERDYRVLVIDLDTQGNTSRTLSAGRQIGDAADLFCGTSIAVQHGTKDNFSVFRATEALDTLKAKGATIVKPFVNNLRLLSQGYDMCIVDTSPDQNHVNVSGLIVASHVIAPLNLGDYALDGVELMLKTIIGVKEKYNPKLTFVGLLPNMFVRNQPNQVAALQQLCETYPEKYMFSGSIAHRSSFETTVRDKQPIWTNKKTSAREAIVEMRAVMLELEKRMGLVTA